VSENIDRKRAIVAHMQRSKPFLPSCRCGLLRGQVQDQHEVASLPATRGKGAPREGAQAGL